MNAWLSAFLNENLLSVVVVLGILMLVFLVVSISALLMVRKLKKRYELFTGAKRRPEHNLEAQLTGFHQEAEALDQKYTALEKTVRDLDRSVGKCVQKVGVVRYNPFDEVGGDLCYGVALLDAGNNGVVLNGIHSRTGSFTYAKPIELGVSPYVLSTEEQQALERAMTNGYVSEEPLKTPDEAEETSEQSYVSRAKDLVAGMAQNLPDTPAADAVESEAVKI